MARRKDGVDEKYRDRYRRWAGRMYKGKHPSHLVQGEKNIFPHNQLIPGYCLLCPMTGLIPTNYRYKRHFRLCHIKHAVLIAKITLLACKCSQVKSQITAVEINTTIAISVIGRKLQNSHSLSIIILSTTFQLKSLVI